MKKAILILLCSAMLVGTLSCNKSDDMDSTETNTDTKIVTGTTPSKEPSHVSETSPDEIYQNILNTYQAFLILKKNNTDYDKLYVECHEEGNEIESAVFHAVLRNTPEKMGYGIKDLNNDNIAELILLDENYHIYTIFTSVNGQPKVVDTFFGDGNDTGAIGSDGTIYKYGYGKGENLYRYAMKISNDGTLFGMAFGCLDTDIDDVMVEYYKIIDGERMVIDFDEFNNLNDAYYQTVGNSINLTKNSGIDFVRIKID